MAEESTKIPHWSDPGSNGIWDRMRLAGFPMPGVARVECEIRWDIDKQKPKKADGVTLKDNGLEPAEVDITLRLTTAEELAELSGFMPMLRPKKGAARSPLSIEHPSPNALGVTSIMIKKIRSPMPNAKDGWDFKITAVEWVPKPKANAAIGGQKGGGGESCAATAAQLQAAISKQVSIQAAYDDAVAYGGGTTGEAGQAANEQIKQLKFQLQNAKAETNAIDSAIKKCKGGGASPPPSTDANDNAFGTDEEALLKQQAA